MIAFKKNSIISFLRVFLLFNSSLLFLRPFAFSETMADIQHKRMALKLKQACEETAAQAIAATTASGQASRIHGKNRKFSSRKEAMAAKARRRRN